MKKSLITASILLLIAAANKASAQSVAINSTGSIADTSALLDLTSSAKGILTPRMTQAQRNAIYQPANGLLIYQTDNTPGFYYNSGTSAAPSWTSLQTVNATTQGNSFNGASQLVQMTAATKLPAVDGSLLTALNGTNVTSGTVADARLSSNVTLLGNTTNAANGLVKIDGTGKLPALDGSQLTNLPAAAVATTIVSVTAPATYTVTVSTARNFIFNFGGGVGGSAAVTVTLPAANSYSAGTIIRLSAVFYTSVPQFVVNSSSNVFAVTTATTTATFTNTNSVFPSFTTDGTNWYKL